VTGSTVTSSVVATEMNLSQVFVRSKLEEKVQGNLLKKQKLEEKLHRKEERKNAKKIFKGFSQDSGEKTILPEIKFSKAVPINGVKKVLKSTGDLVRSFFVPLKISTFFSVSHKPYAIEKFRLNFKLLYR